MKTIRNVLFVALATFVCLSTHAAEPEAKTTSKILIQDTAIRQEQLRRAFDSFRRRLIVLTQRLETGSDADKARAVQLRKALKLVGEQGTDAKFDTLIHALRQKGAGESLDILGRAVKDFKDLREDLRKILALLIENDPAKEIAKEIEQAKALLEKLKIVRNQQARIQAQTERDTGSDSDLEKKQEQIEKETRKILEPSKDADAKEKELLDKVRKPLEKAVGEQGKAKGKLSKGDRDGAGDSQGRALSNLDEAINTLEDLIRQRRQEEQEQKLKNLLQRCQRMLQMQTEVRTGTVALQRDITKESNAKATLTQITRANKLADQEFLIVVEAKAALKLTQDDGNALAFVEAFDQLVKDLEVVREHLTEVDLGEVTVKVEDDVIESLKEMIKALEKAIQNNNQNPPPTPPGDGPSPTPPLVDGIQQLKMIRGLQRRINARTELYARTYKGEQVPMPTVAKDAKEKSSFERVRTEMKQLAARQHRLAVVTREVKIQSGAVRID